MRFPGEQPRWGFIHILLIPLFVLGLQWLVAGLGPELTSRLVRWAGLPPTRIGDFVVNYLVYFLAFMAAITLVLIATRSGLGRVGFKLQNPRRTLAFGIGGGLMLFGLILAAGFVIQLLHPELLPQPFEDILQGVKSGRELLAMLLVGSVLAPLVEEMYFRGMVYPVLRHRLGVAWAIVISGIFFGILHWDLWRTVPLALGGMALAYIYERAGSIYASWLAHGLWNGIMALLVYWGQRMV